jgi:carbamoyl-phosphate synthase/aspartate carbamoyltransferase/dihydroorotase
MEAKKKSYPVTCGATPHHLFLNTDDQQKLGPLGLMKPNLRPQSEVDFFWKHVQEIDIIESDHAPHTLEEKQSDKPPFGVPGLETTLPLLLTAVSENKLSIDDIKRLCHDGPAKIFGIKTDDQTYVEVDENEVWVLENEKLFTKCKWSPFAGRRMKGKVKKVVLHGKTVFENGKILAKAGSGKIIV